MRAIHLASLDKIRPALVLTRESIRADRAMVTVAPISSTIRGIGSEMIVGRRHGLDHTSVVLCDNVETISIADLGPQIGFLHESDEPALTQALIHAFDLRAEELP